MCFSMSLSTTWAEVVPHGLPSRGPDMFLQDMHLMAASGAAAGSEVSEQIALGLVGTLGC